MLCLTFIQIWIRFKSFWSSRDLYQKYNIRFKEYFINKFDNKRLIRFTNQQLHPRKQHSGKFNFYSNMCFQGMEYLDSTYIDFEVFFRKHFIFQSLPTPLNEEWKMTKILFVIRFYIFTSILVYILNINICWEIYNRTQHYPGFPFSCYTHKGYFVFCVYCFWFFIKIMERSWLLFSTY